MITRLVNERSGATLWTDTFNYAGNEIARVPRHIAVDAGNVVRCGLFGASTYHKPLPDAVLRGLFAILPRSLGSQPDRRDAKR